MASLYIKYTKIFIVYAYMLYLLFGDYVYTFSDMVRRLLN